MKPKELTKAVKLSLSDKDFMELKGYADKLGIAPTSIARMFVITSLKQVREVEHAGQGDGELSSSADGSTSRVGKAVSRKSKAAG